MIFVNFIVEKELFCFRNWSQTVLIIGTPMPTLLVASS